MTRTAFAVYWGYKRTQRRVRGLAAPEAAAVWADRHDQAATRLYNLAVALKGLYIKSGQFIGTRADIVPPAFVFHLGKLQDRVPPRPVAGIRATIEREFGRPLEQLFAAFDDAPLAAASLAQVHRARLPDGRDVAVKVQYPEVEDLIALDIRDLRAIVRLLAWREPRFDYRGVLAEVAREIPRELDFVHEAEMLRRVKANLQSQANVIFPDIVDDLLTRRVLVTTYVDGAGILDKQAVDRLGLDRSEIMRTLAAAYGRQIIVDGLFQADPHPGNILVRPDGKIALLDFGLTKELPQRTRLGFARLVLAAHRRDADAVLAAFRDLGIKTRHEEPQSLLMFVQLLLDARPVLNDAMIVQQSQAALEYNPIQTVPPDLVLIGRVIGLLRGVTASLGVSFTPMQMLLPYAEEVLDEGPAAPEVEPLASSTVAGS
ncbi:MAG: AarF/ABC1/UbiB kinase family protein [Dehalococcoidia bacterium]